MDVDFAQENGEISCRNFERLFILSERHAQMIFDHTKVQYRLIFCYENDYYLLMTHRSIERV